MFSVVYLVVVVVQYAVLCCYNIAQVLSLL